MRSVIRLLLLTTPLLVQPVYSQEHHATSRTDRLPDFDIRRDELEENKAALRRPTPQQVAAAEEIRQRLGDVILRWDPVSASPRWISAAGKPLWTGHGPPEANARSFLLDVAALLGLSVQEVKQLDLRDIVPAAGGGHHVYFRQMVRGKEVFQGRVNVTVARDGAIAFIGARLFAGIDGPATPAVTAIDAARKAIANVYPTVPFTAEMVSGAPSSEADQHTVFSQPEFGRGPEVRLVWFPDHDDARLAWEVRVTEANRSTDYRLLIDAVDGSILTRHNLTKYASARVLFADPPDPESEEYAPTQHQVVALPTSTAESPAGWLGPDPTILAGNNAASHLGYPGALPLTDSLAAYDYPFNTTSSALTNAWYWINDAHDRFYRLGFDEAAGNFQQDNFGAGGAGLDAVDLVIDPGTERWFITPTVDGEAPILGFGWLNGCVFCADHDGYPENGGDRSHGFMRDVLFHEYAHGVVGRRVGGPSDPGCLTGRQPVELAEGWGDLFAASFFDHPRFGEYYTMGRDWLRDPRHDLVYGDWGNAATGIVWSGMLWDLRQSMIALDADSGLDEFNRLVVEALAVTPCEPTFVDARDAILAADVLLFGGVHRTAIWNVLAARGLGTEAASTGPDDPAPQPDMTVPPDAQCAPPAAPSGVSAVIGGPNVVRLNYTASGAAAVEIWRDDRDNPADAPQLISFTTDPAHYLDTTVEGGKRYAYQLVALGQGGIPCRSSFSSTVEITATGQCSAQSPMFVPNLVASDGDPGCAVTLSWTAASPACPGSSDPIVYNVYRYGTPGFLPSDRLLIGRTMSTSFTDTPVIAEGAFPEGIYNATPYYLVLAQHGTLDTPPDHRDRGSSQVMQWAPGLPTLGRSTVRFWNFDSSDQGWTASAGNGLPAQVRWKRVQPTPSHYAGRLDAPDEAAGGSGSAWVTGDPGAGQATITSHGCSEGTYLTSPTWDATNGATIVSFDYWGHPGFGDEFRTGLAVVFGSSYAVDIGLLTTQTFEGPGRYGWNRAEFDISRFTTPTSTMRLVFQPDNCWGNAEYGIDNVRIERATVCSLSSLRWNAAIIDDTAPGAGNGNGALDPGEVVRVAIELRNEGDSSASAPRAHLISRAPGVVIVDDKATYPDIPPSSTAGPIDDGFTVALPSGGPCTGTLPFELKFVDSGGVSGTAVWTPEWGTILTATLLQDDFENDLGWSVAGAGLGQGQWQRGNPVGTFDTFGRPANPEQDSPFDSNAQCYVTENGPVGGPAGTHDVDPGVDAVLLSPLLDIEGYKRLHIGFDFWQWENIVEWDPTGNYTRVDALADSGDALWTSILTGTNAWRSKQRTMLVSQEATSPRRVRLAFTTTDNVQDDIMETGVDNVRVEGDRQACNPTGVQAPNPVGSTVLLSKSSSAVLLSWLEPPADPLHDPPAFYAVHVSGTPGGGFTVQATPFEPEAARPLDGTTEFYLVGAVNAGGTSKEEPEE